MVTHLYYILDANEQFAAILNSDDIAKYLNDREIVIKHKSLEGHYFYNGEYINVVYTDTVEMIDYCPESLDFQETANFLDYNLA
jgi:hypothetical protein